MLNGMRTEQFLWSGTGESLMKMALHYVVDYRDEMNRLLKTFAEKENNEMGSSEGRK